MKGPILGGFVRGGGAVQALSTTAAILAGLPGRTVVVPGGHIAIVTFTMRLQGGGGGFASGYARDNGGNASPLLIVSTDITAAAQHVLSPGRHWVDFVAVMNTGAGAFLPDNSSWSWIVVPNGGADA